MMLRNTLILSSLLLLTACSGVKDTLGLERQAPDEFKVVKTAPLEMPSDISALPPPRPGAPRPQERQVTEQVQESLFGAPAAGNSKSEGEALLLQQAGATAAEDNIRELVDAENRNQDTDSNKSVTQRLLGIGSALEDDESVLDAAAEAERLKKSSAKN